MTKSLTILLLLSFILVDIQAQSIIEGIIRDKENESYTGCSVLLRALPDSAIVGYSFSDVNGKYEISYSGEVNTLLLSISALQIKPQSKNIDNKSQTINFTIDESEIQLKEVIVRSTKI